MDWTSIIVAIVGVGGFTSVFLIVEKKSAAVLENAQKLIDMYKGLAEEYKQGEERAREQCAAKEEELMTQIKMNSSLRHSLDDSHTREAVCKLMYCRRTKCVDRDPPFGSHAGDVMDEMHDTTRRDYSGTPESNRYGRKRKETAAAEAGAGVAEG